MLHQFSKIFLVLFILVGIFSSCDKDKDPEPDTTDTTVVVPPDTTNTGGGDTTTNDTIVTPDPEPEPTAITIIGSDFVKYERAGSSYTGKGFNLSRITTAPTEGENQIWDLTTYEASNPINYRSYDRVPVPDSSSFTSATYMYSFSSEFNSNLIVTDFIEVSDAGYFRVGGLVNSAVLDLGNGITLTSSGEENMINPKDISYNFPMNYGDMYDNNWLLEENYRLTAPPFGLSNAPVSRKLTSAGKIEVVGWGKVILPQTAIADTLEVLLVKDIRRSTLNYFLNGSTAPSAMINALGLQEGETENILTYTFISKEFGKVAEIRYNVRSNDTAITPAIYATYMVTKQE